MDLVNTVRKEGSRGGRGDFKWTDVQADQHRENYLGHSVMAPVGRWQKGRDLQWYARNKDTGDIENDGLTEEERARKERQEEIARIKLAEREAMNKALGYEIDPDGPLGEKKDATGANATAIVGDKTIGKENRRSTEKKSEHKRRRRDETRDRDRERSPRRHHDRKIRYDARAGLRSRSRSRERREDDYRRKRSDANHKHERRISPNRRRYSRSSSSESTERRAARRTKDRRKSRSPYRQSPSQKARRHYEDRRQRSRSP